ncbi:adhesion G-protein coupled receptor G1 [Kryptolebias marmoratus]|uniref:Adhesion G protein-coupled receptor G1 n=1 Tax=Kryptolebias marmoratus TaxID=37003 RepID=A0A3Q2ZXW9_KRYMA|nr:adhesion G-protein coupled receptor G1 [Kryptolebias marmoratus]
MEARLTDRLMTAFFIIIILSTGSCENDLFLKFCGIWHHGKNPLSLNVGLSTGCSKFFVSANESSLSINGNITSQCRRFDVIPLKRYKLDSEKDIHFCVHWEPMLDQLMLQLGDMNFILCKPSSSPASCCTDLSDDTREPNASYGIFNGMIKGDLVQSQTITGYNFKGAETPCKELCEQAKQKGSDWTKSFELPCAEKSESEMEKGFSGTNVTSDYFHSAPTVYVPPAVKPDTTMKSKVVITFYKNNSLFQEGFKTSNLLNDVVEVTVENEVIVDLPKPIRMNFPHDVIPKNHARQCVSWDTRKDPWAVNWLPDGCETQTKGAKHTECLCNHLTYFSVLVHPNLRPVRHLLALTAISSLGCALSFISCIALIVFFWRNRRRSKEQSLSIHVGLAVSLAFLSLLFFLTAVLANVVGERVCVWVGALLHYATLSSLTWMGIQVFHTFWLVYVVFRPSPKPYMWYLIGFGLPLVPVVILAAVGGFYGMTQVVPEDDVANPYRMCWLKTDTESDKTFLAICLTNMTAVAVLVISGALMLFVVYREIRTRDEWQQKRVAFLSIWGLSCLFGTTWGLVFLEFGPLSDFILFLSCILNSFQGFFLMLRFCMLDWIRKQANGSVLGSTSSGSTRQHMLQASEKS